MVASADDVLAALQLRREVFCAEQDVPLDLEIDDLDFHPDTCHVVGLVDGTVVAVGRLTPPEHHIAPDLVPLDLVALGSDGRPTDQTAPVADCSMSLHVGRLALRKSSRGLGLGAAMLAGCVRLAGVEWGSDTPLLLELSAQEYAIGFYERCGFTLIEGRDHYLDAGILHRDMAAVLPPLTHERRR